MEQQSQKTIVAATRLTPAEAAKLSTLAQATQRTPSDVLRRLLAQASLTPPTLPDVELKQSEEGGLE